MSLAERVAARWLTDDLPAFAEPDLDRPTTVRGVWIDHDDRDTWPPAVWRMSQGAVDQPVTLTPDDRGRYRVTCDDGVRRRLTLDQLRGAA